VARLDTKLRIVGGRTKTKTKTRVRRKTGTEEKKVERS
jgi:hypothetical protein